MEQAFTVIIFYKYTRVEDPAGFSRWLTDLCTTLGIFGRVLIASEGINGTVEGTRAQLDSFESALRETTFGDFADIWFKSSPGTGNAFPRLRIKARDVILNMGTDTDIDPNQVTGKHLTAEELHAWFNKGEDFEIIDMRNDYEYKVGRFKGAVNPGMGNFRDLSEVVGKLDPLKKKKVVTVCTYGVRCEKASGYLLEQGFEDVYQLHGGIGTYMKKFPGENFEGSLYVFDNRMTEQFTDDYQVVGSCTKCKLPNERFGNCALHTCHRQLIICAECAAQSVWCSKDCEATDLAKIECFPIQ